MKIKYQIIIISMILGLISGMIDSVINYFFFYPTPNMNFIEIALTRVPPRQVYNRIFIFITFSIFGFIISGIISKLQDSENRLLKQKNQIGKVNEELEATNEELLATNEEFEAINQELTKTQIELLELNSKLTESEQKFKAISDQSSLSIIILQDSRVIYANPTSMALTEFTIEQILDWTEDDFQKIFHRDDVGFISNYRNMLDSDIIINTPVFARIITKTGSIKWIEMFIKVIHIKNRNAYMMTVNDITGRKKNEDDLISSEKRYRELYESMMDGYVQLNKDGCIIEFNETFSKMLGYPASDLLGLKYSDLLAEKYRGSYNNIIETQVYDKGYSDIYESLIHKKNGALMPIESRTHLIKNDLGETAGTWSIIHDITKRKIAEHELLKSSKIESLGIFAGGIAHDFNNLLTAILGNISVVKFGMDPDVEIHKYLTEAENASLRAKDLTQQLLTFSRGGAPLKTVISIKSLLMDTSKFVLSGSRIKVEFDIADNLWNADIDRGQVSQVIHNIVLNARQALDEGSSITISAKNKTVRHLDNIPVAEGMYILFSIKDDGPGIPPENFPHIFDPFFTTKERGSGLGLSIVYSIIKKHEGYISVDSAIGKGSTFNIYLPATDRSENIETTIPGEYKTSGGKILIMDDEEIILNTAGKMLSKMGFETVFARNGEEAIEAYKKASEEDSPFCLVIMDLTIPGSMGGKSAIQELKHFDPFVKAIVSSGYSNDPVMANFKDYGFCAVAPKPYKFEELRDIVCRSLSV